MKKIISIILASLILTTTFPAPVMSLAATSTPISTPGKYWDGTNHVVIPDDAIELKSKDSILEFEDGKTYICRSKVTLAEGVRPHVNGTVNIILMDGADLTIKKGIKVSKDQTLNIYAQHENEYYEKNNTVKQGKLTVTAPGPGQAGIGGSYSDIKNPGHCGNINIYGGVLDIKSGLYSAAIGSGNLGDGGTINISGGIITAVACGSDTGGAGIGSGKEGSNDGGNITISGNAVIENAQGCAGGAGIGGGYLSSGGTIGISGNAVIKNAQTIEGGTGGAGIGGGAYVKTSGDNGNVCSGGNITISGNVVIENAQGVKGGSGIGTGTLGSGGSVRISPDNDGNPVVYAKAGTNSNYAISNLDENSEGLIITKSNDSKITIAGKIPDDFTLKRDLTIPKGITTGLIFKDLTVAPGVKLTQNSAITVTGKLTNKGELDGSGNILLAPTGSVTEADKLPTSIKVIQYSEVTLSTNDSLTFTEGSDAKFTIHAEAEDDPDKVNDVTTGTIKIFEGDTSLATSTLSGSPAASHEADFPVTVTKPATGTHKLRAEFTYKDFDGYPVEKEFTLKVSAKSTPDPDPTPGPNPVPGGSDDDDDDDDNVNNTGNNSSHGSTPGQKPAKPAPDTSSENHKWVSENDNWKLIDENGTPAVGWKTDNENWFFLDENGIMLTGWQFIDGNWFYQNPVSDGTKGAMKTGWQFIDGNWFYLNPVSDGTKGAMKTGWIFADNEWFYLNPVSDGTKGAMKTGWIFVDGEWYYLNPVSDGTRGRMMTGQVLIDGKQYFFNPVSDGTKGRLIP